MNDINDGSSLRARLEAWHDAMVSHERRLRAGNGADPCDDECPHAEARALWMEVLETFGRRAHELTFLRSRAGDAVPPASSRVFPRDGAESMVVL